MMMGASSEYLSFGAVKSIKKILKGIYTLDFLLLSSAVNTALRCLRVN
jgi:hypothetical protein